MSLVEKCSQCGITHELGGGRIQKRVSNSNVVHGVIYGQEARPLVGLWEQLASIAMQYKKTQASLSATQDQFEKNHLRDVGSQKIEVYNEKYNQFMAGYWKVTGDAYPDRKSVLGLLTSGQMSPYLKPSEKAPGVDFVHPSATKSQRVEKSSLPAGSAQLQNLAGQIKDQWAVVKPYFGSPQSEDQKDQVRTYIKLGQSYLKLYQEETGSRYPGGPSGLGVDVRSGALKG